MIRIKQIIFFFRCLGNRRIAILLSAIMLTVSLEIVGVGVLAPYIAIIAKPSLITQNQTLNFLYQRSGATSETVFIYDLGFLILLAILSKNAALLLSRYINFKFSFKAQNIFTTKLFKAYILKPYLEYTSLDSSQLIKNVSGLTGSLVLGVMQPTLVLLTDTLVLTSILCVLFSVNLKVTLLVTLVGIFVIFSIFHLFKRFVGQLGKLKDSAIGRAFKISSWAFRGIKEVKAGNREKYFIEKFNETIRTVAKLDTKYQTLNALSPLIIEVIGLAFIVFSINYLLREHVPLESILPVMSFYLVAVQRILPIFSRIPGNLHSIKFYTYAMESVYADLSRLEAIEENSPPTALEHFKFKQSIELCNISFKYPSAEANALKNISLKIEKGQKVGLVGDSGAGKTTLVDIILGILEPSSGQIKIDGIPLSKHDMHQLRGISGYVSQNVFLFDDSLKNNICFGHEPFNPERFAWVLEKALLKNFVESLPQKEETIIGEQGMKMSGGQRQRVGIARALYSNIDVLILDEATSGLDNLTEKDLVSGLEKIADDMTTVVIAHRLSTVKNCDIIYLFNQGGIVAHGTYEELLKNSAYFFDLVYAVDLP